jgi:hypothetical protein
VAQGALVGGWSFYVPILSSSSSSSGRELASTIVVYFINPDIQVVEQE